MVRSHEQLRKIYDRTGGYCHLCGKRLAFKNYGKRGTRGAWHIEHSIPKSRGGTDHLNNLYAACISCNEKKGNRPNQTIREKHGMQRAPLSPSQRKKRKRENAVIGGILGGLVGGVLGPSGIILGAAFGASLGYQEESEL